MESRTRNTEPRSSLMRLISDKAALCCSKYALNALLYARWLQHQSHKLLARTKHMADVNEQQNVAYHSFVPSEFSLSTARGPNPSARIYRYAISMTSTSAIGDSIPNNSTPACRDVKPGKPACKQRRQCVSLHAPSHKRNAAHAAGEIAVVGGGATHLADGTGVGDLVADVHTWQHVEEQATQADESGRSNRNTHLSTRT